jgi:hypothetical protein
MGILNLRLESVISVNLAAGGGGDPDPDGSVASYTIVNCRLLPHNWNTA